MSFFGKKKERDPNRYIIVANGKQPANPPPRREPLSARPAPPVRKNSELDALRKKVERVQMLHKPITRSVHDGIGEDYRRQECMECAILWPCATSLAVDEQ